MRRSGFLGAMLLLLPLLVQGIVMLRMEIDDLTRQADVIVLGHVLSKTCQRDASGRIYTKVELAIQEVWKGTPPGNPLVLVSSGGVLGESRTFVQGQANYEVGEEILAFAVLNDRREAVTLGLAQGKFQLWADPQTGQKLARNPFHGRGGVPGVAVRHSTRPSEILSLADLKLHVRREVR
jgi:hypothetical protein